MAAFVFGPHYLTPKDESAAVTPGVDAPVCDLDLKTCRWGEGATDWSLNLERTGPSATDALRLELEAPATPAGNERMIAVLEGRSMYMGRYPVALQRATTSSNSHIRFSAEFQAPLCTVDPDMVWTLSLKRGSKTLDLPWLPVFQTRHPADR